MLKLVIRFPHMEAEIEKARPKVNINEKIDWAKYEADNKIYAEVWSKWYDAEHDAMAQLEETAFAVAMERVRRKSGQAGYYAGHIGLDPQYNGGNFEIDAALLYPELIAAFEDLQKLGAFEMHFETGDGRKVASDWWRDDDELRLYDPQVSTGYDYDELLKRASA